MPISTPGAAYRLDLTQLLRRNAQAAQVGYGLNAPGSASDFDGDPMVLRGDEYLAAVAPFGGLGVDPVTRESLFRLEREMRLLPGIAIGSASAPTERIFNRAVANAVGVTLSLGMSGPGQTVAHGGFSLDKKSAQGAVTLTVPFPTASQHQSVADARLVLRIVDVHGRPAAGLKGYRVVNSTPTQRELALEFDLARLPKPAFIRWSVPVELRNDTGVDLTAPLPMPAAASLPSETLQYLKPETAIQSTHPAIVALAAQLRAHSSTLQDLVKNTLAAVANVPSKTAPPTDKAYASDAVGYLQGAPGACDSCANLFAALMRANGVPCRPVSGMLRGANQDMHRQNEYFVPGKGWVHIEPQGTDLQTPRFMMLQTGVVPPRLNVDTTPTPEVLGRPSLTTQLNSAGQILPRASHSLEVNYGLFVSNGTFPVLMAHAAS